MNTLFVTISKESFYQTDYTHIYQNALATQLRKLFPDCRIFSGCFTVDIYHKTHKDFYELKDGDDVTYKQYYESAQPDKLKQYYPRVEVKDLVLTLILKTTKRNSE